MGRGGSIMQAGGGQRFQKLGEKTRLDLERNHLVSHPAAQEVQKRKRGI